MADTPEAALSRELQRLFTVSHDIIVSLDAAGLIVTASPSIETVTGVPAQQAVGRMFESLLHTDDIERARTTLQRLVEGADLDASLETRMVRADGIERVVSWRASASIEDARIYAIGRDVTDERVAQAQSIRSHRMEAIAEMTTAAAQDLTRVLSAVYSYVELARRLTPDAQLRRVLDSADGSIRRGGSVVNQLLSFARSQKLAPGPIDVNAFVRGIHGLATRLTGPGTSFEYDLADELPAVKADPTQLELAFVNLCLNAREAMPEGGTVSVITRKHIVSHEVANTSELPEGKCVVLCVRDRGHGMDPVTLSRCVEPFFSTRAAGQRAGLGLPQVQGFAHQCGGAVRVSSQLGEGTTVRIFLPSLRDASKAAEHAVPYATTRVRGTALVVDGDQDALRATSGLLRKFGFVAVEAPQAERALQFLHAGRHIDALLVSSPMTAVDDLVREAGRHRPRPAVIMLAGFEEGATVAGTLPGVSVLRKPFEPRLLLETVSGAIRRAQVRPLMDD